MYNLHQLPKTEPCQDDTALRRALALRALNRAKRIRELEALLRKVRDMLARDPTIWEAELINEIDEVVPDVTR